MYNFFPRPKNKDQTPLINTTQNAGSCPRPVQIFLMWFLMTSGLAGIVALLTYLSKVSPKGIGISVGISAGVTTFAFFIAACETACFTKEVKYDSLDAGNYGA